MRILHLKLDDFSTSRWSGGTTTELFIWPEGANYATRDFQVRISSAVVELPESDFTPLDGVLRYITPLSGGFTLIHPGKSPVVMDPLDTPYGFSGQEPTHCIGSATDFNLMLKGVGGEMRIVSGKQVCPQGLHAFYAHEKREFTVSGQTYALSPGELLVVFTMETSTMIDLGPDNTLACFAAI